jgi:hypothetical protein
MKLHSLVPWTKINALWKFFGSSSPWLQCHEKNSESREWLQMCLMHHRHQHNNRTGHCCLRLSESLAHHCGKTQTQRVGTPAEILRVIMRYRVAGPWAAVMQKTSSARAPTDLRRWRGWAQTYRGCQTRVRRCQPCQWATSPFVR